MAGGYVPEVCRGSMKRHLVRTKGVEKVVHVVCEWPGYLCSVVHLFWGRREWLLRSVLPALRLDLG